TSPGTSTSGVDALASATPLYHWSTCVGMAEQSWNWTRTSIPPGSPVSAYVPSPAVRVDDPRPSNPFGPGVLALTQMSARGSIASCVTTRVIVAAAARLAFTPPCSLPPARLSDTGVAALKVTTDCQNCVAQTLFGSLNCTR